MLTPQCLQTPPAHTTTWVNVRVQGLEGVKNGKYSPGLPVGDEKVGTHWVQCLGIFLEPCVWVQAPTHDNTILTMK